MGWHVKGFICWLKFNGHAEIQNRYLQRSEFHSYLAKEGWESIFCNYYIWSPICLHHNYYPLTLPTKEEAGKKQQKLTRLSTDFTKVKPARRGLMKRGHLSRENNLVRTPRCLAVSTHTSVEETPVWRERLYHAQTPDCVMNGRRHFG
jgi:hypothetical protein